MFTIYKVDRHLRHSANLNNYLRVFMFLTTEENLTRDVIGEE
jgi:hypothetical protein